MPGFDPYYKWLGISPKDQPPNHYRLLGIDLFEPNADVIANAADKQMRHVRSFQTGEHSSLSQKILNEISAARVCLLDPQKRAEYDAAMRPLVSGRKASTPSASAAARQSTLPPPIPVAAPSPLIVSLPAPTSIRAKPNKPSEDRRPWLLVGLIAAAVVLLIAFLAMKSGRRGNEVESVEPKIGPQTVAQNVPEPTPQPRPLPRLQPTPEPEMGPKVEANVEPKAEPRTELKVDPRAEPPIEAKPEPKAALIPEPTSSPTPPILGRKPEPSKKKLAPPDEVARQKALATIRETYKDDYKDKSSLARKLLKVADESKNDFVARYALLQTARDVAAEAGQGELAFQAIDAMAADYEVSGPEMKADVIDRGARLALLLPQKAALVDVALQVMDEAIAEDNFGVAKRVGRQALQLVRLSKDATLVQNVVAKNKEVEVLVRKYADVETAMTTLNENPSDPAANLVVGKYLCFSKGEWNNGLPMLASSNDTALKALAERDLSGPVLPNEQMKLADEWWNTGDGGKSRAMYWYNRALPQLTGLEKDRAEKRIAETTGTAKLWLASLPPTKVVVSYGGGDKFAGKTPQEIALLTAIRGNPLRHGLWAHPTDHSLLAFDMKGKGFRYLTGGAGIVSSLAGAPEVRHPFSSAAPLTFRIVGDGKLLWKSNRLQKSDDMEAFKVLIEGVSKLELFVDCHGSHTLATAVWIDPALSK